MAEDKRGFILYADQKELFDKLPDDKAGELIKHIFSYVNDENPDPKDFIIDLAFTPIKQQLKRDLKHWESIKQKRSEAGKLGGRPKKQEEAKKANGFFDNQTKAKKAVTVKDIVKVKDKVNDNDIDIREANFKNEILLYQNQYSLKTLESFFLYWSEPDKSRKKMKFEQQKTWDLPRRLSRWASNDYSKPEKEEVNDTYRRVVEKLKNKSNEQFN